MNDAARRQAELFLERNEDISAAAFAGRVARQTELGLDDALDLYEELTGAEVARESDEREGDDTPETPTVTDADVADHYGRLGDLYAELGTIDGDTLAAGVTGRKGWYKDRPSTVGGWDREGRQSTLARDYDTLRENLSWVDNRSIHATIQYSKAERYAESWTPYNRTPNGREWKGGESPTLDYADIEAYAPFADIDLEDEYKRQRPDGDLDTDPVEAALERYVAAFAELAGGREHVYALDSVGGAYVMAAPTCTRPIAEHFADDRDARERVFSELRGRVDTWLGDVRDDVNDAVPDTQGVFEPDLVNQKNRNYKAPMAVHKSLDGVVTPLGTENPTYEFTHLSEADDGLIDDATEWAAGFTAEHDTAVEAVVCTLWPDEYSDAGTWEGALQAWLDEKQAEAEERERRRKENAKERRERVNELGTSLTGQSITPHVQDVLDAADAVDIRTLVKRHCKEWEPKPAQRTDHFNPGSALWKESDSGTSCFVNTADNTFTDTGDRGGTGGPAKFMALKENAISYPEESASGEPFWIGVEALRDDGYDIPVYIPERGTETSDGTTYEKTPYWALRKAAVALRVVPQDGFVEEENDDGSTWEKFPGRVAFDRTLDELEALDIDHGWERDGSANKLPSRVEAGLEKDPEDDEEKVAQAFLEMCRGA